MSELGNIKSVGQQNQDATNKAADTAKDGIRSAQKTADQTLDKVAGKVDEVRNQVAPTLEKVSGQAQKLLQQGRESLNDATERIKGKAAQASDQAVGYTKDEPIKAMLIAAASGAVLMGLITLMARSRD